MAKIELQKIVLKDGREILFRNCGISDLSLFPSFQKQIASETFFTMQMESYIPPWVHSKEFWLEAEKDPLTLRIGGFYGEKLISLLGFHPLSVVHPWTSHVGQFGILTLKEFWGLGIGVKMIEIMETFAKQANYTRIEATTRVKNERAVKLFAKMGFEVEGTRKRAALIQGEYWDEYFIAKLL